MMKMFTDTRANTNVKSLSDFITITWLLTHASEGIAQCDDHCSLSFSIKQWKVRRMCSYILCVMYYSTMEQSSGTPAAGTMDKV